MISKDVKVPVPIYVKKFLEMEFGVDAAGKIFADKASLLGRVMKMVVSDFPYQIEDKQVSGCCVTVRYLYRSKSACVPSWKLDELSSLFRGIFDMALINEVRAIHRVCGRYDGAVFNFLKLYNIEVDVDILEDSARSIYRNYLDRVERKREVVVSSPLTSNGCRPDGGI